MESILHHASDPLRFCFYCLHDGKLLTDKTKGRLTQIVGRHGAALNFVQMDASRVNVYGDWGPEYITGAAYYRLLIPEALPQLDRCLYLDCDVVALGDIAELWDIKMPEAAIAAVRDCYVDRENLKKYENIKCYFNSGVLLMDLRRWRNLHYIEKCLRLASNPELHKRFADQDLLNIAFCDEVHVLHPRWNIQTGQKPMCKTMSLADDWREWWEICQAPKIAHFTSERKPWNMEMKHRWSFEYWRMLAMTPWGEEMKDLRQKILMAKGFRLKAQFTKLLRWLLTVKKTRISGALKVSFCGRLIIDQE